MTRSLWVSAPPRACERETALADSRSFLPGLAPTLQRSSSRDQHCGFWRRASGRGKQSPADFGRSRSDPNRRSLATVGKGSMSGSNKRSLEVSAPLRARASETAFAGSGSAPPRPASHSKESLQRSALCPLAKARLTAAGGLSRSGLHWRCKPLMLGTSLDRHLPLDSKRGQREVAGVLPKSDSEGEVLEAAASAVDFRVIFLAVQSCTTGSRCNVDADGNAPSIFSVSHSVFGGRAGLRAWEWC